MYGDLALHIHNRIKFQSLGKLMQGLWFNRYKYNVMILIGIIPGCQMWWNLCDEFWAYGI